MYKMKCKISTYHISTRSISNKNYVKQQCYEHIDPSPPLLVSFIPEIPEGRPRSLRRIEVLVLWIIFQTSPRVGYRRKSQEDAMFSPRFFESSETLELFETFWRDSTAGSPCTHVPWWKRGLEECIVAREFPVPGNDLSLPLNDSNLSWTLTSTAYFHVERHPFCTRSSQSNTLYHG